MHAAPVKLEITVYNGPDSTRFERTLDLAHLPKVGDEVEVFADQSAPVQVERRRWQFDGTPVLHLQGIWVQTPPSYEGINWAVVGRGRDARTVLMESGWSEGTDA